MWSSSSSQPPSVLAQGFLAAAAAKNRPRRTLPQPKTKKERSTEETTALAAPKQAANSANAVSEAKDVAVKGEDHNYKRAKTVLDEGQGPTQPQTCNSAGDITQEGVSQSSNNGSASGTHEIIVPMDSGHPGAHEARCVDSLHFAICELSLSCFVRFYATYHGHYMYERSVTVWALDGFGLVGRATIAGSSNSLYCQPNCCLRLYQEAGCSELCGHMQTGLKIILLLS